MVSKEEWMMMFDYKGTTQKDVGPKPSAKKRNNQAKAGVDPQHQAILKYLCEVLEKENLTP